MTQRKLFSVELDICAEYPTTELAKDMSNFGLVAELIDANGPGGGNPVYKFSSFNKDDLIAYAIECGYDEMNYGNGTYIIEEYIEETM